MVTTIIRVASVAALLSVVATGGAYGNHLVPQGVVVCAGVVLAVVLATL